MPPHYGFHAFAVRFRKCKGGRQKAEGSLLTAFRLLPSAFCLRGGDRVIDYLGYLPASGAIVRPELQAARAAAISGDDVVRDCCFYIAEEWVYRRHIHKSGYGRTIGIPAHRQHDYLAQLRPGHVSAWAELKAT